MKMSGTRLDAKQEVHALTPGVRITIDPSRFKEPWVLQPTTDLRIGYCHPTAPACRQRACRHPMTRRPDLHPARLCLKAQSRPDALVKTAPPRPPHERT